MAGHSSFSRALSPCIRSLTLAPAPMWNRHPRARLEDLVAAAGHRHSILTHMTRRHHADISYYFSQNGNAQQQVCAVLLSFMYQSTKLLHLPFRSNYVGGADLRINPQILRFGPCVQHQPYSAEAFPTFMMGSTSRPRQFRTWKQLYTLSRVQSRVTWPYPPTTGGRHCSSCTLRHCY